MKRKLVNSNFSWHFWHLNYALSPKKTFEAKMLMFPHYSMTKNNNSNWGLTVVPVCGCNAAYPLGSQSPRSLYVFMCMYAYANLPQISFIFFIVVHNFCVLLLLCFEWQFNGIYTCVLSNFQRLNDICMTLWQTLQFALRWVVDFLSAQNISNKNYVGFCCYYGYYYALCIVIIAWF